MIDDSINMPSLPCSPSKFRLSRYNLWGFFLFLILLKIIYVLGECHIFTEVVAFVLVPAFCKMCVKTFKCAEYLWIMQVLQLSVSYPRDESINECAWGGRSSQKRQFPVCVTWKSASPFLPQSLSMSFSVCLCVSGFLSLSLLLSLSVFFAPMR